MSDNNDALNRAKFWGTVVGVALASSAASGALGSSLSSLDKEYVAEVCVTHQELETHLDAAILRHSQEPHKGIQAMIDASRHEAIKEAVEKADTNTSRVVGSLEKLINQRFDEIEDRLPKRRR